MRLLPRHLPALCLAPLCLGSLVACEATTGDCAPLEKLALAPAPSFELLRKALPSDKVSCSEPLGGGTLTGRYERNLDGRDRLTLTYAAADLPALLARHGVQVGIQGTVSGEVQLRRSREPRTTSGKLSLLGDGVVLGKGSLFGPIPELRAGAVRLEATIADGELSLQVATLEGADLRGDVKGTVSFAAEDGLAGGSPRMQAKLSLVPEAIEGDDGGRELAERLFVGRGGKLTAELQLSGSMDAPKLKARGKAPGLAPVEPLKKAPNEDAVADLEQAVWGFVDQAGSGTYRVRLQAREALLRWPPMMLADGKPELVKAEGERLRGVKLSSVRENGVLTPLGLRTGDLLVEVNGRPLDSARAVEAARADAATASELELTLERRGKPVTVILKLEGTPAAPPAPAGK